MQIKQHYDVGLEEHRKMINCFSNRSSNLDIADENDNDNPEDEMNGNQQCNDVSSLNSGKSIALKEPSLTESRLPSVKKQKSRKNQTNVLHLSETSRPN